MSPPLKLLFVCVENSCRSQMAEALARMAGHEAVSAGSRASGLVNPKAIAAMAALDYDLSTHVSEGLDAVAGRRFDAAVSMGCGDACPQVPARVHEDWAVPDPKQMDPDGVAAVRDEIARRLDALVARLATEA